MTPRHIIRALAAVAAAATLLAGCGGSDSNASSPPKSTTGPANPASGASGSGSAVTISDFKFAPTSLTVKRGAKVTVTNDDSTAHTATADDGNTFDTGTLDPGSSQPISVGGKPGSYAYHCSIHPFMKGTIVVR